MGRSAMKLRTMIRYGLLVLTTSMLLAACGGISATGSTNSSQSITFWAAPNPPQQAFWSGMAKQYMTQYADVKITVKAMSESPSSEAAIQAALAGGTGPTASENIFTGFAGQLMNDQAIVPLDQMPGWNDLITARHMNQSIASWKYSDGHTYVLPIYTNAVLLAWRLDLLKQLGYDQPPRTYSQVMDLGTKLKQKFPDKFIWARGELTQNTWWQRWFDFFTLYDAASNGQSLISGNKVSANDQSAINTLSFMRDLAQKKLLLTQTAIDPFETGTSMMSIIGPWQFTYWQQKYPQLKLNKTYALAPPPVPDSYPAGLAVKTFADAKGIVIYKQASAAQQQAMWQFVKWVFSDPAHDLLWLQTTGLPSARDDLSSNTVFKAYLDQHSELASFAQNIPNAVPPLTAPKYTDIQVALGDDAVIPVVKGQIAPDTAWENWKKAVQPLLG